MKHSDFKILSSRLKNLYSLPYDFTYMWNRKNKINGQTKQNQIHRYREQTDGRGIRGLGEKGEGIKKHKMAVTKQSRGYKVQLR